MPSYPVFLIWLGLGTAGFLDGAVRLTTDGDVFGGLACGVLGLVFLVLFALAVRDMVRQIRAGKDTS